MGGTGIFHTGQNYLVSYRSYLFDTTSEIVVFESTTLWNTDQPNDNDDGRPIMWGGDGPVYEDGEENYAGLNPSSGRLADLRAGSSKRPLCQFPFRSLLPFRLIV